MLRASEAPDPVDLELPPVEPLQLAIGAAVVVLAVLLAKIVRVGLRAWLSRRRTPSYARVFSLLGALVVGGIGVGVGLTLAFPSVRPVDVLGGVGIVSVAVGIAFQSVLSNLFAGVLLLVREPFRAGDQIGVGDIAGTVEEVNLRETVVRTFDGRRVLVPNSTVHGEVVTVQTGYQHIRSSVVVGVDYSTDLARAKAVALGAVRSVQGVAADPAPECLLCALSPSTVDLEVRFWSGARQLEALEARDGVIAAVLEALADAGVRMPAEIRVLEPGPGLEALVAAGAQQRAG